MANENTLHAFPPKAGTPATAVRPICERTERPRDPRLDARLWVPLATIEESWIVDDRPGPTSARMFEDKMTRMLGGSPISVSDLRSRRLLSNR